MITTLIGTGCMKKVKPGYVGVKTRLYGSNKGVDSLAYSTGRYFLPFGVDMVTYPTFTTVYPFTQSTTEGSEVDEAFEFQTRESVKCNVDIGVQCKADPVKAYILYQTYRDDMESIIKKFMRNDIRDEIIKYASNTVFDSLSARGKIEMMKVINVNIKSKYLQYGLIVENITMLSDIRPPKEVTNGITAKIVASQKAMQRENELREAKAMAEKKVIEARADSESNKMKQISITPQIIEWEKLQVQKQFINKWNGAPPLYINGNGGNFNMLFSTGK
jgi:regulator of protease activity HflC (stomatin/prohibitin superfamily)